MAEEVAAEPHTNCIAVRMTGSAPASPPPSSSEAIAAAFLLNIRMSEPRRLGALLPFEAASPVPSLCDLQN
jgi:hypothetical protein